MTTDLEADMQHLDSSPLSVVVGIDGSRAAVDAASWAADEAVSRDIPLRLVYVGPLGHAALHNTDCSVLICESQNEL
jgi:Universal stress protein family